MSSFTTLTFRLPWPPSVNSYWRAIGRGRVILSAKGRDYRLQSGRALEAQGVPCQRIEDRLVVSLLAQPPDRRVRDLDNLLKPLLDCLVTHAVIKDDGQIDDLRVMRGERIRGGQVWVLMHPRAALPAAVSEMRCGAAGTLPACV